MNTFRLLIALMLTVTFGSSKNFFASSLTASRSCSGVRPAALTSLRSGSEIIPSGLTVASADTSFSLQYSTCSTSSGPIT